MNLQTMKSRYKYRRWPRIFLSGLFAVLPIVITIAVLLWLVSLAESLFGGVLRIVIPDDEYRRGMGLVVAVLMVFGVGVLMEGVIFRRLLALIEEWLNRIPLVKTVYSAVRDLTSFFSKAGSRRFSKVVMVRLPDLDAQLIGFITLDDFSGLPFNPGEGRVAVYLPMSYQIGGYTLFLRRDALVPVEMTLEEAMRFVVTAGMSRSGQV